MKIAVMQPYFFPYIGYFQLIQAVDKFVFFDDVNFIKRGWIHRNNILVNGDPYRFTVPLQKASQNKLINEVYIINDIDWSEKLDKTLTQAYKKAPFFEEVSVLYRDVIFVEKELKISDLAINSIKRVLDYLGIEKSLFASSDISYMREATAQEKIISICQQVKANHYINPINGQSLYNKNNFNGEDITLSFIRTSNNLVYHQGQSSDFVPNLSIIDVLMHNSVNDVKRLLNMYELV